MIANGQPLCITAFAKAGRERCARWCLTPAVGDGTTLRVVAVSPPEEYHRLRRLFRALAKLFPVRFESREPGPGGKLDGVILLKGTRAQARAAAESGLACFAVVPPSQEGEATESTVRFADDSLLPGCLRGQNLSESAEQCATGLAPEAGERVLAFNGDRPFWLAGHVNGFRVDLVCSELPHLERHQFLADYFNGERFLSLLPLLNFLRMLTASTDWEGPPLRACFIFDDASLAWPWYGLIDFPQLARHALAHQYHAAIAIIPLDGWRADRGVTRLFREHGAQLSLVIHGNEHTHWELARARSHASALELLGEALKRVESLEQRHHVQVCRVMEPPYGIIGCERFDALADLGYEAALVTPRQFLHCNRPKPCPAGLGLAAVECLPGGLGGIPRIVMSPRWKSEAILAAFLGQPVVIAGHHYDARNGLEALEQIARTVNGLGPIQWCNLTDIARSSFQTRRCGAHLSVRMGSRRVEVNVPEGIRSVTIERPWLADEQEENLVISGCGVEPGDRAIRARAESLSVSQPGMLSLKSLVPTALHWADVPAPRPRVWPLVRRTLMEWRDRSYPYLPAFAKNGTSFPPSS